MRRSISNTKKDLRWAAVRSQDGGRDGEFFYAVKTTGVYCRPSCAARPKPENVAFHKTRAEAERAGFRPCKRCRPDRDALHFTIAKTSLGLTLVARSTRGVCAILFGDSRIGLLRELRGRFPGEFLIDRGSDIAREIIALVEDCDGKTSLKLDMQGTEFQKRVWQELQRIPSGATAGYADIARRIGMPNAARAVARACAANPLALAVPCHRVVRSDGTLSGYRWGIARKKTLLKREAAA